MAREIPVRIRRLSEQGDDGPDLIAPLAVMGILVALLGTTCLPLWTAVAMLVEGQPPAMSDAPVTDPSNLPATRAALPPRVPAITLAGVLVFFCIAILGIVGGIGTILRREWGRRVFIAYAALVLLYLITAVYLRFRFGIEGLTQTAPTPSALTLSITCVFGVLILVAVLMVKILRYFTQPAVARQFR
jgi:hypothetical protein